MLLEKEKEGADKEEDGEGGATTGGADKLEDKYLPKKESPAHNLGYGQMLMVSRSYASAISQSLLPPSFSLPSPCADLDFAPL